MDPLVLLLLSLLQFTAAQDLSHLAPSPLHSSNDSSLLEETNSDLWTSSSNSTASASHRRTKRNGRLGKRFYYQQEAAQVVTDVNWIRQAISRHNYYRYYHNAPPLRFNITLCQISQAYANKLARENLWGHNYGVLSKYALGENLAKFTKNGANRYVDAGSSVDLWYREVGDYNFQTGLPKTRSAVGHFTQLVWRSTYQMGTAFAVRRVGNRNYVYVVANYYPRGNVNGGYISNVQPRRRRGKSVDSEAREWSLEEINAENDEAIDRYKTELEDLLATATKEIQQLPQILTNELSVEEAEETPSSSPALRLALNALTIPILATNALL